MTEFAKILETKGNYLRVQVRTGERFYAPIVTMGTNVSIPSEKWIEKNRSNFLALVSYEKDIWESPMIIGFYPVKGADANVYNTHERLLNLVGKLISELSQARVNTQLGPQQFMPDTLMTLNELSEELEDINNDINSIKL